MLKRSRSYTPRTPSPSATPEVLTRHLPRFLPPAVLARSTAVDLHWIIRPPQQPYPSTDHTPPSPETSEWFERYDAT